MAAAATFAVVSMAVDFSGGRLIGKLRIPGMPCSMEEKGGRSSKLSTSRRPDRLGREVQGSAGVCICGLVAAEGRSEEHGAWCSLVSIC